jgi:chromosomal replication initiation ATPase DnaA
VGIEFMGQCTSEARQVALFVARRLADLDLKAIAARFGLSYTGVSRRVGEMARRFAEDATLRAKIEKIQLPK